MIEVHEINGKRLVRSFDLYPLLGCSLVHYSRWAKKNILECGVKDFDYMVFDRGRLKGWPPIQEKRSRIKTGRPRSGGPRSDNYYVTIDFAKALCLVVKTNAAKRTRLMLYNI